MAVTFSAACLNAVRYMQVSCYFCKGFSVHEDVLYLISTNCEFGGGAGGKSVGGEGVL